MKDFIFIFIHIILLYKCLSNLQTLIYHPKYFVDFQAFTYFLLTTIYCFQFIVCKLYYILLYLPLSIFYFLRLYSDKILQRIFFFINCFAASHLLPLVYFSTSKSLICIFPYPFIFRFFNSS